jgi:uncharacterized membrane protein YbhN (UPF0104 family)
MGWWTMRLLRRDTRRHIDRRGIELAGVITALAVIELAAAVGLAYVAGFGAVRAALSQVRWPWLLAVLGALGVSFAGYYFAYQGIYRAEGGYRLAGRHMRALVIASFGGLFSHGGTTPDDIFLQAAGAGHRDSLVRVGALSGLEQGVLAFGGWAASIAVLTLGFGTPPENFTLPWAVVPVPAALVVLWITRRYTARLRPHGGWRGKAAVLLDSVQLARKLAARPLRNGHAFAAMGLFWAGDAFAVWAALSAFGFGMDGAAFTVGFCTGMVFTRRVAPLAGAGILMLILPVTIAYSGAPLAVAVAGVFAYRILSLWLPMPFAFAGLPVLREVAERAVPGVHQPGSGRGTEDDTTLPRR